MAKAGGQDAKDLAEFVRTGSAEAFARVSGRYAGLVYRACLRRLGSAADAEDASQAVFVALARKAGKVRPQRLASWLHGAAMRAALFIARSRSNRARYEREAARMKAASDKPRETGWDELGPHLDAEVARLPAKQREVVARHYLAGLSRAELAQELGVPQGTVQSRLGAGLERLRARLGGRGAKFGAAALAGLLASEAAAGAPASLVASLPALVGASAAAGAAAGAGAGVSLIAEGVLKAMFWTKVKIAAGIIAAATVVAGAGTPLAVRAVAGGKKKGPKIGSASKVIRARVTAVKPSPVDGPATVTIDKGRAGGVRKGFVFDIKRDGKRINGLKIDTVAEKQASGKALEAGAWQPAKIVKVGDVAVSRLTVVDPEKKSPATTKPAAETVNGLRLTIETDYRITMKPGKGEGRPCYGRSVFTCRVLEDKGDTLHVDIYAGKRQKGDIRKSDIAEMQADWTYGRPKLRWENVGKKPLLVYRDRCCDLYNSVSLKGPDGKLAPARTDNRTREKHMGTRGVFIAPGKFDEERFDLWHWVQKPTAPGEYTLCVEFESRFSAKPGMKTKVWKGKLRSNAVKVTVGETGGKAVNGLRLRLIQTTRIDTMDGKQFSGEIVSRGPREVVMRLPSGEKIKVPSNRINKVVFYNDGAFMRLRWENVGSRQLNLRRSVRGISVFLVDADGKAALSTGKLPWVNLNFGTMPGGHVSDPFDPWRWVVKPGKPGEYTLWVEFESKFSAKPGMKTRVWKGKLRSNAVKVVIAETGGKAVKGLQLSLAVEPVAWKPGGTVKLTCLVRNVSRKPIRIAKWGLMDVSPALEVTDAVGRIIKFSGGRNATKRMPGDAFPLLKPGASRRFTLTGRLTPKRMLIVGELCGGWWTWQTAGGTCTLRAVIDIPAGHQLRKRFAAIDDKFWTGKIRSNAVKVRLGPKPKPPKPPEVF